MVDSANPTEASDFPEIGTVAVSVLSFADSPVANVNKKHTIPSNPTNVQDKYWGY